MIHRNRLSSAVLILILTPFLSSCRHSEQRAGGPGFVSIFDGETLDGWRSVPTDGMPEWSVEDGAIVGAGSADRLVYLVWSEEDLADFELTFSYKMLTYGNSGVELRSRVDTTGKRPFEGYHVDFGHVGIGPGVLGAWDFHFAEREEFACPRGTSLVIDKDGKAQRTDLENSLTEDDLNKREWNHVHVIANGNFLKFSINGMVASEFTDNHPEALGSGMIGLQIHDRGMRVAFKDLWIKRL